MYFPMNKTSLLVLFILACASNYSTDGLRILGLFPYQAHSHFVTCEELMKGLAAKGHQVDVYSHFPLKKAVKNYQDFSLKGTLPALANNLTYNDFTSITTNYDFMMNILSEWARSTCELLNHPYFQKLRDDPPKNPPYDLIIMEFSQSNCFIHWGRYLNIPVIGIVTLPILDWIYPAMGNPFNLATDSNVFSSTSFPETFFDRLNNVITYHTTNLIYHHIMNKNDRYVKEFFGPNYPSNVESVKDFSLILLNHNFALHGLKPFTPSIVPVGGLHVVDHNDTIPQVVKKWLDDSKDGFIYFSFGSMIRIETFPEHVIKIFYKSFEKIAPVRVLLKITNPEMLPAGLPSNVLIQPWLPQIQVLKHKNIKAFVTHGGLMGTQESIYFGVPMIAIPLFGDQQLNADIYLKKKVIVKVNIHEITKKTFVNALNEILNNPSYKNNVMKLSNDFKDRPMSPMDTAIFWVEYISRHGKDALRSPSADMPWWKASLVDIYGFIIATVFIILYVLKKLVRFIFLKFYNRIATKKKAN